MINNGQWQVMTAAQQAGIVRQATEAHMTADAIGKMATRQCQNRSADAPY
jgi:hypothetical protein